MKKTYTLLIALLVIATAFANTGKDSLSLASKAPKVRSFAKAPKPAKDVVNLTNVKLATPKTKVSANLKARTFKELDAKIGEDYFQYFQKEGEFTPNYITENFPENPLVSEDLAKAIHAFNRINETQNFVDNISPDNLIELPVGLKKTIANVTYTVAVSNAKLYPEYTELTAFVKIQTPEIDALGNPRQLFFGATNVRLSHDGGIIGEWNLVLLGDFVFGIGPNSLIRLKGGFNMETGNIDQKCYATIDCNGFKEAHLEAEVQFSRNIIEPLNDDYTVDNTMVSMGSNESVLKRVSAEFSVTISDWNDMLVEVSLPKFQMTSFKGTAFEINNAVFDYSDTRNSESFNPPDEYNQYLVEDNHELWRGIYIKSVDIALPKQFQRRNSDERVTLGAIDMLVDGMGVTGKFYATNVLPLEEGVADKWQFSVDSIGVNILANSLTGAGFNGKIVLPVTKEVTAEDLQAEGSEQLAFSYTGVINPPNEYILSASADNDIKFDIWKAQAILTSNSYIELTIQDDKFKPKAVLHGSMHIKADKAAADAANQANANSENPDDKKLVEFPQVTFQNLQLQTVSPIIDVDYFGYSGEVKFANFPVTLSNINLTTTATDATLNFNVAVNLMENNLNANTTLGIKGVFEEGDGLEKWKYDDLILTTIAVDGDLGGVKFAGSLNLLNNDPVYGDGFMGNVSAKYKGCNEDGSSSTTGISSTAVFGSTDFRYWYIDAIVDGLNIPLAPPLNLKGFGGGAYYRMKRNSFGSTINASGTDYVPDADSGLGIKAILLYAMAGSSRTFNGGVGYEIAFNSTGGLNRIAYFGEAHFMQSITFDNPLASIKETLETVATNELGMDADTLENLKNTDLIEVSKQVYPDRITGDISLDAFFSIEYDFTQSTLHGTLDTYLNVANVLRGRASGDRMGWAVAHFGPDAWYIHMGTPTDRLGIKFGIGSFALETGGYFMIGDQIPGSPPPPPIVAQILGTDIQVLDSMRDENALGDGRGFAYGMDFSVDTGDISFLIFYGRFQAGVGLDIMVKDYGAAECAGSGQIGINGWYMNGQSYAYLQGEVGVKVKLLFIKKKITIFKAGAAVLLQTKMPNPSWFRGYVGGHFSVLGGLVKGKFRLKIELGSECDFINGAPLDGLKVIADINPANNTTDVDVFTLPQVGFNLKVNESFEFEDDEGISNYRINLDEFKVENAGTQVQGDISWNSNKDLLTFTPFEVLPPETGLDLSVTVSFEELKNGSWQVMTEDGQVATETEVRSFTTGTAPDYIPLTNIKYSYPVISQKYVHKDEYTNAYVKLKQGQSYLFNSDSFSYRAIFESSGNATEQPLSYNASDKLVSVNLPSLSNSVDYSMILQSVPPENTTSNFQENYSEQDLGEDTTVDVKNVSLDGTETNAEITDMLSYTFRTSEYSTFQEKINAKNLTQPIVDAIYSDVHSLEAGVNNTEPFEIIELNGGTYTNNEALIQKEAVLDDAYYTNEIYPLVYQNYPLQSNFTVNRDTNVLGVPPTKAIENLTWYETYLESDPSYGYLRTRLPYRYYQAFYYKQDFIDIQYKVVNAYLQDPGSYASEIQQYDYIINGIFPYLKPGNYKTNIQYVLPGGINGTSKVFTFNRPN